MNIPEHISTALKATGLPLLKYLPEISENLRKNGICIVKASPGAGKSTLVPLYLMGETVSNKKILLLEPRVLAARSVATRMADMLGEQAGASVGYRVRHDTRISKATRLEVVTEGIFIRMLQDDPFLEQTETVIIDEFHERSLNSDISLAYIQYVRKHLNPALKLVLMSATMDSEALSSYLTDAPVVEAELPVFPVEVIYSDPGKEDLYRFTARTIHYALQKNDGDILCFLPGLSEINQTADWLQQSDEVFRVMRLHSEIGVKEQQEAILPDPGNCRKVILSSAIAETSVTIEGVTVVVDSGLSRKQRYMATTGISKLVTLPVSLDSAIQRTGRAGRTRSGVCYRLWPAGKTNHLDIQRKPEIMEADLSGFLLTMYGLGFSMSTLPPLLSHPPEAALKIAHQLLVQLDALDGESLSETGKEMLRYPAHPRIAHLIVKAKQYAADGDPAACIIAADIATLMDEAEILPQHHGADIENHLDFLHQLRKKGQSSRYAKLFRNNGQWRKILEVAGELEKSPTALTGILIAAAYPERIAYRKRDQPHTFQMANGQLVKLESTDPLNNENWLAVALIDSRMVIRMAAPLVPAAIPERIALRERIFWNYRDEKFIAVKEKTLAGFTLESESLKNVPLQKKLEVIREVVIRKGLSVFNISERAEQLLARISSLKKWGETDWPDLTETALLEDWENRAPDDIQQIYRLEDFKKFSLYDMLLNLLDYNQQQRLETWLPESYTVPSGFKVDIKYFGSGQAPELHVRLQEMFGTTANPAVYNGQKPLVLHLLSPGFKPVQVTTNLVGFWKQTYPEIRRQLKIRYPRHSWPENPLEAEAIRGPLKRKPPDSRK